MAPNPDIMQAVEKLNYRVTVGDVAAQAGLEVAIAEQGLLALASEVGGHMQVAESGDVVYQFPRGLQAILLSKSLRLRLQAWWDKVWGVLFYLIRISFGILLLLSIVLILAAIVIIVTASKSGRQDQGGGDRSSYGGSGGNMVFFPIPRLWFGPDFFWVFYPDYYERRYQRQRSRPQSSSDEPKMNILEGIFSFLFGDGNPNRDLEERRWQTIATVIRNHQGAVTAEQIAPYLDDLGSRSSQEYEDYMLPVLSRFNGRPEVSPEGGLVYHFPELQTTASDRGQQSVQAYLKESPWRFSQAQSWQILVAIGLGAVNLIGALSLGSLLAGGQAAAELGGYIAFIQSIYGVLLGYGMAFLAVPLVRYFWVQRKNKKIEARNEKRQERAIQLNEADEAVQQKLAYAQQFAAQTVIDQKDVIYTTERDLVEQEAEQRDRLDAEWQKRLEQS